MKRIHSIIKRALPQTLLIGVSSVLAGTSMAVAEGCAQTLPVILCVLFAIVGQLSYNFSYLYFDHRNHNIEYTQETLSTIFRLKKETDIHLRIRMLMGASLMFAATIGITIISYAGSWSCLLGGVMFILLYLSIQGPLPLAYTIFTPLLFFLIGGPLGVVGTFLLQFEHSSFVVINWNDAVPVLLLSIAIGFASAISQIAVEYEYYRTNILYRRDSAITEIGRKNSRRLLLLCGFAMWGTYWLMLFMTPHIFPWYMMIMPTIYLATNLFVWQKMKRFSPGNQGIGPGMLALLNMLVLSVVTLIIYLINGSSAYLIYNQQLI